ncbi:putative beta-lysine N-acetyltransferase [Rapidithrix thailandica]|uniref:Beta-lysine N-acetyltransferase n=1 Tax=Rapidithrix thailandica TaxID=413964 RepID=A0AAW9S424_9BACT
MKFDCVEQIGQTLVQHGPNNNRVYLMKLHPEDHPQMTRHLVELAEQNQYSKIFAKIPDWALPSFSENGFEVEASVPNLFNGEEDGHFIARFMNTERKHLAEKKVIRDVIKTAEDAEVNKDILSENSYEIRLLGKEDVNGLIALYQEVFEVYPFPVFDPEYVKESMDEGMQYFGVVENGQLLATSSAEINFKQAHAEMTDFATRPEARGNNLSLFLLQKMEEAMKAQGIKTLFTIARATSYGINKTFGRLNYHFAGTLTNNTLIGKSIESMNVWFKHV